MAAAKTDLENAFEPVRTLNKLALDSAAKMVEMNLDLAKRYTEMTLSNAREALELKDPAAIQAYLAKQPEALKAFADTARTDAEAAVKIGMSYFEEAGKLVKDSTK